MEFNFRKTFKGRLGGKVVPAPGTQVPLNLIPPNTLPQVTFATQALPQATGSVDERFERKESNFVNALKEMPYFLHQRIKALESKIEEVKRRTA